VSKWTRAITTEKARARMWKPPPENMDGVNFLRPTVKGSEATERMWRATARQALAGPGAARPGWARQGRAWLGEARHGKARGRRGLTVKAVGPR
jgi:hypothetical protein